MTQQTPLMVKPLMAQPQIMTQHTLMMKPQMPQQMMVKPQIQTLMVPQQPQIQTPMMPQQPQIQPHMQQPEVQEQQPQITEREDETTDELKSRTKRFIPGLNLLGLPKNNFKHPWYRMMVLPHVGWVGGECGLGECKYVNKNLRNP